jgi:hypothetical protein
MNVSFERQTSGMVTMQVTVFFYDVIVISRNEGGGRKFPLF